MPNRRISVSKAIREQVLREFHHRCAICGTPQFHLLHLDGNPANHTHDNLLPVCQGHELVDPHDPTRRMDLDRLRLFRQYKDPVILTAPFEPLFKRFRFLLGEIEELSYHAFMDQSKDLLVFIRNLEMGAYYCATVGTQIRAAGRHLLDAGSQTFSDPAGSESEWTQLRACIDAILGLIMELPRYQRWLPQSVPHAAEQAI